MSNALLSARMQVPVDAGDDGVVVTVLAKVLRFDARTDVVFVLLVEAVMRGSVGGMIGVDMLTELRVEMVVAAAIAFEVFVTV